MSVHFEPTRGKYVVRWREERRNRLRRFGSEAAAETFDARLKRDRGWIDPNAHSGPRTKLDKRC
jgi:hypothetical protein